MSTSNLDGSLLSIGILTGSGLFLGKVLIMVVDEDEDVADVDVDMLYREEWDEW